VDLDKSGGAHDSRGDKINDAGQVIGSAWSTTANAYHAFTWRSNGAAVDLGTLGGTRTEANDVNRAGWVVGLSTLSPSNNSFYNAFLWIDNGQGIKNLNDLVDPADPLQVPGRPFQCIRDQRCRRYCSRRHEWPPVPPARLASGARSYEPGLWQPGGRQLECCQDNRPEPYDSVAPINSITLAGTMPGNSAIRAIRSSVVYRRLIVTFKPASTGTKSATLSVNGSGNGLRVVALSGKGT
jgi:probable HAF family extracellular repeat protein